MREIAPVNVIRRARNKGGAKQRERSIGCRVLRVKMSRKCKSASSTPVEDSVFELRTRMARMLSIVEITTQKNNMVSEYRYMYLLRFFFYKREKNRGEQGARGKSSIASQLRPSSMRDNIDDL